MFSPGFLCQLQSNTFFPKLHKKEAVNYPELFVTTDSRPGDYKLSCDQAIISILNIDPAIRTIICE